MKEFKTLEVPAPVKTPDIRPRRMGKCWKVARTVQNGRDKNINFMVELYYKQILEFAKSLVSALPDSYSRTVFEKDYKEDNSESCLAMHSFITPSFYWQLECDFAYWYRVEYDFYNCPFEDQIRAKIEEIDTLSKYSKQWQLKPNCEEFLKRVFQVQDEHFTFIL